VGFVGFASARLPEKQALTAAAIKRYFNLLFLFVFFEPPMHASGKNHRGK
jgi:hypothetical protein